VGYRLDRVRHIHSYDGAPLIGTTTALEVLAKPLTWWASGMAVGELGWLNPKKNAKNDCLIKAGESLTRIKLMTIGDYMGLLDQAYRAHNKKKDTAKDEGIDLHAQIESYIKSKMACGLELIPDEKIKPFVEWCDKFVKRFLFSELCCYSKVLHVGGIADFGYEDMEGNFVLGDIKSAKEAYYSHWLQVGGYDLQISENGGFTENGERVFTLKQPFAYHAIFCAGAGIGKPFFNRNLRTKQAFSFTVNLYREKMFFEEAQK